MCLTNIRRSFREQNVRSDPMPTNAEVQGRGVGPAHKMSLSGLVPPVLFAVPRFAVPLRGFFGYLV